jgi:hypothetical protein
VEEAPSAGGGLIVAAISHVYTIRRAAEILGRTEDMLWHLSDQLDPEDGKLWIHDVDDIEIMAFTDFGLENLQDHHQRPDRSSPLREPSSSFLSALPCGLPRMVTWQVW